MQQQILIQYYHRHQLISIFLWQIDNLGMSFINIVSLCSFIRSKSRRIQNVKQFVDQQFLNRVAEVGIFQDSNIKIDLKYKQMLAVQSSVISKISVQSKKKSQNSKASPSTHTAQSPQPNSTNSNDFTNSEGYWDQSSDSRKLNSLERQIQHMEKNQHQMQAKFQKCIENMLAQIQRNNENNARLAVQVSNLKVQVAESKKDILIIDEYMKANLKKQIKGREMGDSVFLNRQGSARELFGSCSGSKNAMGRRTPSKFFKSKLLLKQ